MINVIMKKSTTQYNSVLVLNQDQCAPITSWKNAVAQERHHYSHLTPEGTIPAAKFR